MSKIANREKFRSAFGFTDLLFNLSLGFAVLFAISIFMVNPITKKQSPIIKKAEVIITMEWDRDSSNDMDLWVRGPSGNIVSFLNREAGLMNLEKDDLGTSNDTQLIDGKLFTLHLNREVITLRGIVPGEYIVNVHSYKKTDLGINKIDIEVIKLNPYKIFSKRTIEILRQGEEVTLIRFTLDKKGNVTETNTLPFLFAVPHPYGASSSLGVDGGNG